MLCFPMNLFWSLKLETAQCSHDSMLPFVNPNIPFVRSDPLSPSGLVTEVLWMMCERKECAEECLYQTAVMEVLLAPVTAQLSRPQVRLTAHVQNSPNSRVPTNVNIPSFLCLRSSFNSLPVRPLAGCKMSRALIWDQPHL